MREDFARVGLGFALVFGGLAAVVSLHHAGDVPLCAAAAAVSAAAGLLSAFGRLQVAGIVLTAAFAAWAGTGLARSHHLPHDHAVPEKLAESLHFILCE